jgi:hypothetical protein
VIHDEVEDLFRQSDASCPKVWRQCRLRRPSHVEGKRLGRRAGSFDVEGKRLGRGAGSFDVEGKSLGRRPGSFDVEGKRLGRHPGSFDVEGKRLGRRHGSFNVEGRSLGSLHESIDVEGRSGVRISAMGAASPEAPTGLRPPAQGCTAQAALPWGHAG